MNLCLLCRDVGASHGGLVRATCDLSEALAQAGHSVYLLTDGPGPAPAGVVRRRPAPLTDDGMFGEAEPETAAHNLAHAAAVYREVRWIHEHEQPVDAVLAPLWRSEGAVCLLDDRFPTIVSCMTSLRTLTEVDGRYWSMPDIDERLSLERQSLARSRYLHGLTASALRKTIDDYGLGPEATAVIGRGLRDRAPIRPATDGPRRAVRVLFVGRLERRKGVDVLLAAASELMAEGSPVTFTLVGADHDPGLQGSFERQRTERRHDSGPVRFAGSVSDRELDQLFGEADIVCCPSRYESHGVVLIEAMMHGKAILTCATGGIAEVVEPGLNALLCQSEDAVALADGLRTLAGDPALRAKLGAAARKTFERRYAAPAAALRMESFVEEVIIRHRAAAVRSPRVRSRLEQLLLDVGLVDPENARPAAEALVGSGGARPGWVRGLLSRASLRA